MVGGWTAAYQKWRRYNKLTERVRWSVSMRVFALNNNIASLHWLNTSSRLITARDYVRHSEPTGCQQKRGRVSSSFEFRMSSCFDVNCACRAPVVRPLWKKQKPSSFASIRMSSFRMFAYDFGRLNNCLKLDNMDRWADVTFIRNSAERMAPCRSPTRLSIFDWNNWLSQSPNGAYSVLVTRNKQSLDSEFTRRDLDTLQETA